VSLYQMANTISMTNSSGVSNSRLISNSKLRVFKFSNFGYWMSKETKYNYLRPYNVVIMPTL
jgi:hypothetical protein